MVNKGVKKLRLNQRKLYYLGNGTQGLKLSETNIYKFVLSLRLIVTPITVLELLFFSVISFLLVMIPIPSFKLIDCILALHMNSVSSHQFNFLFLLFPNFFHISLVMRSSYNHHIYNLWLFLLM